MRNMTQQRVRPGGMCFEKKDKQKDENIIIIIIYLHGLGRFTCTGIDALPSFPGASTISSSSRFVFEGVFRESGVVHFFKMVDPVLFVYGSHVLYSKDRTKIIMKNSAIKSQKPSLIHAAGKVMTACCDNHMNVHKLCVCVCVDKIQDFLNTKQIIYTVNIVFLNSVQVWCCDFLFERDE
jgi:hypothetical protein